MRSPVQRNPNQTSIDSSMERKYASTGSYPRTTAKYETTSTKEKVVRSGVVLVCDPLLFLTHTKKRELTLAAQPTKVEKLQQDSQTFSSLAFLRLYPNTHFLIINMFFQPLLSYQKIYILPEEGKKCTFLYASKNDAPQKNTTQSHM